MNLVLLSDPLLSWITRVVGRHTERETPSLYVRVFSILLHPTNNHHVALGAIKLYHLVWGNGAGTIILLGAVRCRVGPEIHRLHQVIVDLGDVVGLTRPVHSVLLERAKSLHTLHKLRTPL